MSLRLSPFIYNYSDKEARDDIAALNARRAWIIDQFGALIRNTSIPKSDQWIQLILDWLVLNGLFVIKKKSGKSSFFGVSMLVNMRLLNLTTVAY